MSAERAALRSGRVGGPIVVALVLLLTLIAALSATWLAHRETEAVRPESTQPMLSGLEPPDAPSAPSAPSAPPPTEASSRLEVELSPADPEPVAPGPDPLGHVVWGFVLDDEEAPIPEGAYLSFTDTLGERLQSRAGRDGSWSMTGLASGRWFVKASSNGFVDANAVLDLEPGSAQLRRDFTLEPRTRLLVRVVTPDGRAFSEADRERAGETGRQLWLVPVATMEPPSGPLRGFKGNWVERRGASRVRPQPGGGVPGGLGALAELELFEPLPLHVSLYLFQELVATQEVEPGAEEVVFVLDAIELAGMLGDILLTLVEEETGEPIEDASVSFHEGYLTLPRKLSDGRFEQHDRLPGRYDFFITAPQRESLRLWLDLAPGQTLERTIALRRGVAVRVRAVDEEGLPYPAQVEWSPLPGEGEVPAHKGRYWHIVHGTGPDGTFDLTQLGPGRWLLQLQDRHQPGGGSRITHMSPNVVVDTLAGPVTDLVVRLEPVSHVVVSWSGPGRERLGLRFLDQRGLVRVATRFWSAAPQRIALPPGSWRLRVVDETGATVVERGFTLGAEPVPLELGGGH